MAEQPRPEEKAISEVIKVALSAQFDELQKMVVNVQSNFLKLLQGQADSVNVAVQDVVKEEIHIQEIEIQTTGISIDPLSALLGKIRLNEPIDSHIRLVLTEDDLNHTMNSDYVIENLKPLDLEVNGAIISTELLPPFTIRLLSDNRIRFTGIVKVNDPEHPLEAGFTGVIHPRTEAQPILLETFCFSPGRGARISFVTVLMNELERLINQPYFELNTFALRIESLEIREGNLITQIEVHAREIPSI